MAKKMRRILALVLALVLCAGQLAIPAAATEEGSAEPNVTVDVVVTPVEGGTQTTTTTTSTASDAAAGTSTSSTTTEVVTVTGGGTQTDVDTTWTSTETQTGGSTTAGNPTVETDTNVVTTITGSETENETITHSGNTEIIEGSLSGQETTDTVGTTTTTTTTTGEYLYDKEQTDKPVEETLPNGTNTSNGDWAEGEASDNAWTKDGGMQTGDVDESRTTEETTPAEDVTPDAPGATINLTPNGKTVTVTKVITLADVLAGQENAPDTSKGTVTELKDDDGNLIGWEVTYESETTTEKEPSKVGEATSENGWVQQGEVQQITVKPSGYTAGTTENTEGNVTTKTVVEEITDSNGNFLYYKVTTTTTEKTNNEDDRVVTESSDATVTTPGTEQPNGFTLPDRPEESTTTNSYGDVTKVTVTDLMEGEDHVGYTITTTITTEDGEVIRTETKNIYGTSHTIKTDVEKDPTTEKTATYTTITTTNVEEIHTTESSKLMELVQNRLDSYETEIVTESDTYQLVETDDGMYFLYQGKMYEVAALANHGKVTEEMYLDVNLKDYAPNGTNDIRGNPGDGGGYTGQVLADKKVSGTNLTYFGYGLYSNFLIRDNKGNGHDIRQYALKDASGNTYYVYCVEMGTAVSNGANYSSTEMTSGNLYSGDNGNVSKLSSVANNGFWGTDEGIGSLDAVKSLLERNGYASVAASLTAGQALAATQAAIWKYGTDGNNKVKESDMVFGEYTNVNGTPGFNSESGEKVSQEDITNITTLRNLLVQLAEDTTGKGVAETIDAGDITAASITVKSLAEDKGGTNDVYNTDVAFKLEVSTSSINGDLVLDITDANGTEIGKYRLAGEDSNSIFKGFSKKIYPNADGYYTIENVELTEGVVINLNLKGVQHLNDGVVIYSNKDYQDFIGLTKVEQQVNLNVKLEFNVSDPEITHTHTTTTEYRTDTQAMVKTDTRTDKMTSTKTNTSGTKVTEKTHDIDVYGTVTVTETKKDITKENRTWKSNWKYLLTLINGEDGGEEDGKKGTDILDEEVPLANAPKTGDVTALLAVVSGLSLGGMVLLRKRKEEE